MCYLVCAALLQLVSQVYTEMMGLTLHPSGYLGIIKSWYFSGHLDRIEARILFSRSSLSHIPSLVVLNVRYIISLSIKNSSRASKRSPGIQLNALSILLRDALSGEG